MLYDDYALAPDEIAARVEAEAGSNALLNGILALRHGDWPCGHVRVPENTHTVHGVSKCRRCRRERWNKGFARAVFFRQAKKIRDLERLVIRNRAMTHKVAGLKREVRGLKQVVTRLQGVVHPSNGRLAKADIQAALEDAFELPETSLFGQNRQRDYVNARAVAMRIWRDRGYSLPMIARLSGKFDHTSVLHALASFETYAKRDPRVIEAYLALRDRDLLNAG